MSRLVPIVLLVLLLGTVGCGKAAAPTPPEAIIQAVLDACQNGDYSAAARYFEGGQERLRSSPDWAKSFLDRISDRGNAQAFQVEERKERGDTIQLQITTYSDEGMEQPLRLSTWSFVKTRRGWVISQVE